MRPSLRRATGIPPTPTLSTVETQANRLNNSSLSDWLQFLAKRHWLSLLLLFPLLFPVYSFRLPPAALFTKIFSNDVFLFTLCPWRLEGLFSSKIVLTYSYPAWLICCTSVNQHSTFLFTGSMLTFNLSWGKSCTVTPYIMFHHCILNHTLISLFICWNLIVPCKCVTMTSMIVDPHLQLVSAKVLINIKINLGVSNPFLWAALRLHKGSLS